MKSPSELETISREIVEACTKRNRKKTPFDFFADIEFSFTEALSRLQADYAETVVWLRDNLKPAPESDKDAQIICCAMRF